MRTFKYNLRWLEDKFSQGETIKFLFFWGHKKSPKEEIGKFCFSQWYELPFIVDGVTYPTAEHWMMANKALLFEDIKTYDKIIAAKSAAEAKSLGREVIGFDEQIWVEGRFDIVVKGNIHKFNQHPQFADFLLNTNERVLVEASPIDRIWGIGLSQDAEQIENPYFWNGQNLLGFALMETRDFLKTLGLFNYSLSPVTLPWKAYPTIEIFDSFWRMGIGEDLLLKFSRYYHSLTEREKMIFRLSNPEPHNWVSFYSDRKMD